MVRNPALLLCYTGERKIMAWFIIFISIIIVFVMLFRYLRKREMEAFREADMSVFEDFKAKREKKLIDPIELKAKAFLASGGAKKSMTATLSAQESSQPNESAYVLKKDLFDEVHRLFYENLERVAGKKFRIFVSVPLHEFIRTGPDKANELGLRGKHVSFLLCNKNAMTVACGIQLRGAGSDPDRQFNFLKELFRQIEKPLLDFPLVSNISEAEIRENLQDIFAESDLARSCPRCGREMMMRKAIKGKNAGKKFWVCTEFPSCKGITRIGRFS